MQTSIKALAVTLASCWLSACFSLGPVNGASKLTQNPGCELTLQANTFAGMLGNLTLRNSGSYVMTGWTVQFDLPTGGHLSSGYGANFKGDSGRITVTPLATATILQPGDTVTLGYDTTLQAANVQLTAGLCSLANDGNTSGTATVQSGAVAPTGNFANVQSWSVTAPEKVSYAGDVVSVETAGSLVSAQSFTYGVVQAGMQAASGKVTSALSTHSDDGQEELSMEIHGDAPGRLVMTALHAGASVSQVVFLNFDATGAVHHYGFVRSQASVVFTVDNVQVWSIAHATPDSSTQSISLAVSGSDKATADFSDVSFTPDASSK